MLALAVACIANFTPNFAMYQTSPFGADLMADLAIDSSQFSLLFSAPLAPGALAIVAGLFIDRIGPKKVIGIAALASAVGCVMKVFSADFTMMLVGSVLAGMTACFLNAGAAKILAGYFPPEEIGPKTGVLLSASTLAMTVALMTAPLFGTYRAAFSVTAALGVTACVMWWVIIKNPETGAEGGKGHAGPSMGECLGVALRSRSVLAVALGLAFVLCGNVVVSSFMPMALASKGVDSGIASVLTSLFTIGAFCGCFVGPSLVTAIGGRQKPVMLAFCILGATGIAFSWLPSSPILVGVLLFSSGVCAGGLIPMTFALPMRFREIGIVYAGTAGGVVSTIQTVGAILVPSYIIAPIAGGNFGMSFLLGGAALLVAAGCYALAKMD